MNQQTELHPSIYPTIADTVISNIHLHFPLSKAGRYNHAERWSHFPAVMAPMDGPLPLCPPFLEPLPIIRDQLS